MLQQNALLVSFSASQWTARKLDKEITNEVHTSHNAKEDAGRYNKLLIAKEHTDPIAKVVNKARTFHYEKTLAWGDNNERLLSTKMYFDYLTEMINLKSEFETAVRNFLANYDRVIDEAKIRLNGMFKQSDYPSRNEIESKFAFSYQFMPVPDNDIRLNLQNDELDKIKASVEAAVKNRLADAVKEIWTRVKDSLTAMRNKLQDSDAIFRDSLFSNVWELVELLPKLNVTDDANINAICNDMAALKYTPDEVRANAASRNNAAKEVDDILKKFNSFF